MLSKAFSVQVSDFFVCDVYYVLYIVYCVCDACKRLQYHSQYSFVRVCVKQVKSLTKKYKVEKKKLYFKGGNQEVEISVRCPVLGPW